MKLHLDLETRSRQDLRKVGVYRYSECPDFQILMCSWNNGSSTQTAIGHDEIAAIPGLWNDNVTKVAHNAQFERVCLSRLAGEWQSPYAYHDTMAVALENGLPAGLDALAKALGAPPKDSAGKSLINLFCVPRRDGGWNGPDTHPLEWLDFIAYCEQDVDTLIEVDKLLGGWPTEAERLTWCSDQRVNDHGLKIDVEMAKFAQIASEENTAREKAEVTELTGVENPGSVQQMMAWAASVGLELPNLQAQTVTNLLADQTLDPTTRRVFKLRQELALAAASKYTAGLNTVSPDGRVRGAFKFFGAHTGRWSGRGLQPQNLPRAAFKLEVDEIMAIADLKEGLGATSTELKALVRALFLGPYTIVDYGSIEARVIAWLAGEQWVLDAFRAGRDIYVETAKRMGGLTRPQGKIAVLALGFAGGINSLKVMGAEDDDATLQRMVNVWRKANPNTVQLWRSLANAVEHGGRVGQFLRITRDGDSMALHLPSGRALHYHGVKWERYTVEDPKTLKRVAKEGWRYDDPGAPGRRIGTYGGRLAENATQAVARDILANGLVNLHRLGYDVAGHVHDEFLVEGEHPVHDILSIVCDTPPWAKGLPIGGAGFVCQRYQKERD